MTAHVYNSYRASGGQKKKGQKQKHASLFSSTRSDHSRITLFFFFLLRCVTTPICPSSDYHSHEKN